MYINLLNLVVTLFWTCCDLDRKCATEQSCIGETLSDIFWSTVHGVASSPHQVTASCPWLVSPSLPGAEWALEPVVGDVDRVPHRQSYLEIITCNTKAVVHFLLPDCFHVSVFVILYSILC